jgi:hypothetical protein
MVVVIDPHVRVTPGGDRGEDIPDRRLRANSSREPPFLLLGLSYMRDLPPERADSSQERIGGVDGGGWLIRKSRSDT